jgi:predicted nucleic acid-binding protein
MNVLLDTNILARMLQPGPPSAQLAQQATDALRKRGDQPCLVPQNFYELWVVATRPAAVNGIGLTVAQAEADLIRLKSLFSFLPDVPAVYAEWERLVTLHQVIGRNAHDARLVAAMVVHGITHLLTFNIADFARFSGIMVLDPALVAVPPGP